MKTKQERIQEIGENGPFQVPPPFQEYDEKSGWICIDGYYSAQQLRDIANVMDDTTADGHPPAQATQDDLRNSLLRGKAQNEEPRVRHLCNMGVGCEEAGICYAEAHGQPEQCGRPTAE